MKQFIAYYNKDSKTVSTFRLPKIIDLYAEINEDHVDVKLRDIGSNATFRVAVLDIRKDMRPFCHKMIAVNYHIQIEAELLRHVIADLVEFGNSNQKYFMVENYSAKWQTAVNEMISLMKVTFSASIEVLYRNQKKTN